MQKGTRKEENHFLRSEKLSAHVQLDLFAGTFNKYELLKEFWLRYDTWVRLTDVASRSHSGILLQKKRKSKFFLN